jgi:hypothetical protein
LDQQTLSKIIKSKNQNLQKGHIIISQFPTIRISNKKNHRKFPTLNSAIKKINKIKDKTKKKNFLKSINSNNEIPIFILKYA